MTDVLYPYRATPVDTDLIYSVRSLVNMPHGAVIVAGDKPNALPGVRHVRGRRIANRYQSSTANILAGLDAVDGDSVIVLHDDMLILKPWVFRHQHRGPLSEYLGATAAAGGYRVAAAHTLDVLRAEGIADPLFYSMHTPTVYEVEKLRDVIRLCGGRGLLLRTVYWNIHPQPAELAADPKVRGWREGLDDMDVVSTSDGLSRRWAFRRWVDARFPDPSPYEAA